MIITCPSCSTQFNLPDSSYTPGRKSRCSQCQHIFLLPSPAELAGATPADFPKVEARPVAQPKAAPSGDQTGQTGRSGQAAPADLGYTQDGFSLPAPPPSRKKSHVKRYVLGFAVTALLVLVVAMGIYAFTAVKAQKAANLADMKAQVMPSLQAGLVRQYMLDNGKMQQRIYVMEGVVHNYSDKTVDYIQVEVLLFGQDKSQPLVSQRQYCGPSLTLFQLKILGRDEIIAGLNNQLEIVTKNVNIKPGDEVRFLAVILDPPANMLEFGVRVVDFKFPENAE